MSIGVPARQGKTASERELLIFQQQWFNKKDQHPFHH
jgi:hypothetical protein